MKSLGSIKEVDLRDYWQNEATDFTPWLAEEANLKLLGEVISMELEYQSREEQIDGGRADILCVDLLTEKNVIIENQLEKTDPDHLGRIMSYAAALDAYTVIWIASSFDEQYRAAIDWLNQITDEEHNFFGIEIKLFQIGDSVPAPYFKLVVQPNGWSKQVKANAKTDINELSDLKKQQLQYWIDFNSYMQKNPSKLFKPQKGHPHHWINISMGKSGIYLSCQVNSMTRQIGVTMIIQNSLEDKTNYDTLLSNYQDSFNKLFDVPVEWKRMDDRKQSNICVYVDYDFREDNRHEEQFQWMKETVEKFEKFFKDKIKQL